MISVVLPGSNEIRSVTGLSGYSALTSSGAQIRVPRGKKSTSKKKKNLFSEILVHRSFMARPLLPFGVRTDDTLP
jgi:hypothetical protein